MITRWIVGVAGLAMLGYGVVLAVDFATTTTAPIESAIWFVGGTVVHDAVLAPIVGLAGWLLARVAPPPWRAPIAVGAATTGVLVLLALPELVRRYPAPANPGLHERDYFAALLITLAVVWALVVAIGIVRTLRAPAGTPPPVQ